MPENGSLGLFKYKVGTVNADFLGAVVGLISIQNEHVDIVLQNTTSDDGEFDSYLRVSVG